MRLKIFILIPILLFSFDFKEKYTNKEFKKICLYGINHFNKIKNNEDTLSLVGFSCVKSDYFIYLPKIINNLKYTKKGRLNSIYFSLLLLQKKLLISYVLDKIDISYYRLPKIDNIVSIVVNKIISKQFTKEGSVIVIKNDNLIYRVYEGRNDKVFIDVYNENQLISTHWYR